MYAHTIKSREPKTIDLYGGCICGALRYKLSLKSKDDAQTIICHDVSSKRASGGAFGLKTEVPLAMFRLEKGQPKRFTLEDGVREFCGECGAAVSEHSDTSRSIMTGTLDDGPDALPPSGEVFIAQRARWMPQIPDTFQKAQKV